MKILVTGAAGFIGSHVCERLAARGHEVVGVDCFDDFLYSAAPKRRNAAQVAAAVAGKPYQLVEADIGDAAAMKRLCARAERVLHLAAVAGVRPSLRDPARYMRVNLEGTINVLEAARTAGIERVAFASSSSVYGVRDPAGEVAFREDDPCLTPASPYGASKRAGELLCSTYTDLYGIGISALRFFTVYGPRQRPDMAIYKFVKLAAEAQPIPMYGDGSSRRDYTYIDDIVAGTVAAVERVEPAKYRVYNLGGTHTTSLRELIATIGAVTGLPIDIQQQPNQLGDVPVTYADITQASRDLGYAPTTDVRTGIERFWAWYRTEVGPTAS